jgi:putative Holliday junction resolvase
MNSLLAEEIRDAGVAEPGRTKSGRILAIDYGRERIGLAVSDELGLTANPLEILSRTNRREDLQKLRGICRIQGVVRIVVGLPLHISGDHGEMAEEARRFAKRIEKELGMTVELWDERLTTWEARQTVAAANAGTKKRSKVDDVAAAILLRDYLEAQREKKPFPLPEKD